jgi:signal transduction histidine kinase
MSVVLIADDEEAMLEIFAEIVTEMGHEVISARDGEEALLLARTHSPRLVISDYMMPRRTGVELLRALRADPQLSEVPFVLLSAAVPRERSEASLFLRKPVDLQAFERAVDEGLKAHRIPVAETQPVAKRSQEPQAAGGARGDLLNWVAHELKTPLSSARLNAQILLRKLEQNDLGSVQRYAESVVRQVDRMNGLVTSILDAARLNDGKVTLNPVPTELVAYLHDVLHDWRDLHPDTNFELRSESSTLDAVIDRERIRHILNNLLSNAVKYNGASRRVAVELAILPGTVSIAVRDWGIGIPAADVAHVFDRFHRVENNEGRGHGLGLHIAASLVRLHGGSLSVKSVVGEGSVFTMRLPMGKGATRAAG